MKLSGYFKYQGNNVKLVTDYEELKTNQYDEIYMSKVFVDTKVPEDILKLPNIKIGGTGFFYDKAPPLPDHIEHHMPDYHLYDDWLHNVRSERESNKEFEYYTDYSIGFTTRGCFRGCEFCVNKNYKKVNLHSPLNEFLDESRKYICLLDDNILGYGGWKDIIAELRSTDKYFQYKQGIDERILTDEKCKILSESKYKGDYIFAFDNIADKEIIEQKLQLWRKYCNKTTKFYVFCGFDRNDKWDYNFWVQDLKDTFERIKILMKYGCLPYIMRFNRYGESPYKGTYINLARWCNQPNFYKKVSYRKFCEMNQEQSKSDKLCSAMRYMQELEEKHPEIAGEYFDLRMEDLNQYK
jgi:hypothetical protein